MVAVKAVALDYGLAGLQIEVPEDASVLMPRELPLAVNGRHEVESAIRKAVLGGANDPLVRAVRRVVVVFPDITRPMPNKIVLPIVLRSLHECGIPASAITLLCATGSHRPSTPAERVALLGSDLLAQYRVVDHDAQSSEHVLVGEVDGTPILLDREYVDSDLRIVTGFVEPHFFAGFSGGPKAVCPGVAALETILEVHSPQRIASPKATFGRLIGNPVHDYVRAAAALCPPQVSIDVTLNSEKQITAVFAGSPERHFDACAYVEESAICVVPWEFDVVVTTNSGYPLDQNFYQCGKGLAAAERVVRRGGDIVMVAECSAGMPPGSRLVRQLREAQSPSDLLRTTGPRYIDRWAGQILGRVLSRARISMYAEGLSDADLRAAFIEPVANVARAIDGCLSRHGPGARLAVIPHGPLTVATVVPQAEDMV